MATLTIYNISKFQHDAILDFVKRLEGVEGPDQSLVTPGAERPKEQDGGEDLRDRSRVTPLAAEEPAHQNAASMREDVDFYRRHASIFRGFASSRKWWDIKNRWRGIGAAEVLDSLMRSNERALEPPSDASKPEQPPQSEASTEAEP